jgi:hypothetical protein
MTDRRNSVDQDCGLGTAMQAIYDEFVDEGSD